MKLKRRAALRLGAGALLSPRLVRGAESPAEGPRPILGLWLMGQSLCDGSESLPLVTPEDSGWGNLAFRRGVRTWLPNDHPGEPERRADESFSLVPLRAEASGGLGETVANGLADHLASAYLDGKKPGRPGEGAGPSFLVACAGQGGRQIQELSGVDISTDPRTPENRRHGGGYYRTSLDDARRAVAQARQAGRGFRLHALYWMQGEGNGGPAGGIRPTRWDDELPRPEGQHWYRGQLIAYRRQWSDDLRAITGQEGEIPMFTYQTLGPAGEAQLMAADADPHLHLVGPHYAVPCALNSRYGADRRGDAIHLAADGERWWGEQVAKVMDRVLRHGERWQPLRPRQAWLEEERTSVLVDFSVPRPPLVLDTDFLARQESAAPGGGYVSLAGFRLRGPEGWFSLAGVEVAGPTRLRLRLARPVPEGAACGLHYGQPWVGTLGEVTALREGEMAISGKLAGRLEPLTREGAFFVANTLAGPQAARAVIRGVREESGQTWLGFRPDELRNGVGFAAGQTVMALRPFTYGNLRDSDPEPSVHRFADEAYGARAGRPYPLWNWCVLFDGFPVASTTPASAS